MSVSLKDQVVLVLGASSGIGRETAVLFAREGARVVASARRGDRLRALQEQLVKEGHSIDIAPADASAFPEMEQLAERTHATFGKIDVLVYVTGTNVPDRSMKRLNHRIWDTLLSVNLHGAYYSSYAASSTKTVGRSFITARKRSNPPLTQLAVSSTASCLNSVANPGSPTDFPEEPKRKGRLRQITPWHTFLSQFFPLTRQSDLAEGVT